MNLQKQTPKKKSKKAAEGNVSESDTEVASKSKLAKKSKKKADDSRDDEGQNKTRIKIRLDGDNGKKVTKRKRDEEDAAGPEGGVESLSSPKKKKKQQGKTPKAGNTVDAPVKQESESTELVVSEADKLYLDISQWKSEREGLDGSFDAARALFTLYGPWKLPTSVNEDKFSEIAKTTLSKMERYVSCLTV